MSPKARSPAAQTPVHVLAVVFFAVRSVPLRIRITPCWSRCATRACGPRLPMRATENVPRAGVPTIPMPQRPSLAPVSPPSLCQPKALAPPC
eukprot:364516-Chlamydomonas_euryale.AAC.11